MVKQLKLFENEEKRQKIQKQIDSLQYELNYDTRDYPIRFIVDLYNNENEIYAPEYQRKELLWSPNQKARFIESLLLDYPIPLIFLADTDEGNMEIVDGLQRISTLSEFLAGDLKLVGLKKLTELNDCTCDEMPDSEIRRLKARSLRVIVLKHNTPADVRKELFDRLNTSSLRANTSEVRAGRELDNPLMILIKELAEDRVFRENTNLSENRINRKEDIELVTRFFAYSNSLEKYTGQVMNFIDDYVRDTAKIWSSEKEKEFRNEFNRTMKFVSENFERGFQKENRNQTPRVRFESLSVGINLALRYNPNLVISKNQILELLESDQFKEWTTSDAANNRNRVVSRIYGVRDYLLKGGFNES